MDDPGISMFQPSIFDKIEVNTQEAEELEAIEDEKRRKKELEEMVQTAFDDLEDESGTDSADSSSFLPSINEYGNQNGLNGMESIRLDENLNAGDKEYKRRSIRPGNVKGNPERQFTRAEVDNLIDEIDRLVERSEWERTEFSKKLMVAEKEKRDAYKARDDLVKQLADSKRYTAELEGDLATTKEKLADAEEKKINALHEAEMRRTTIRDLEERLKVLKGNNFTKQEETFDLRLKELTLKHKSQISDLNMEMARLIETHKQNRKIKDEFFEFQCAHQKEMAEKEDIINQLSKNLSKMQSKCRKLEKQVADYCTEISDLRKSMEIINVVNGSFKPEVLADSKPSDENGNVDKASNVQTILELKVELRKAVENLRTQQLAITYLHDKLREYANQITDLQDVVDSSFNKIHSQNKEIEELKNELKNGEPSDNMIELTNIVQELEVDTNQLRKETEELKVAAEHSLGKMDELKNENRQINVLQNQLENALKETQTAKELYIEVCSTKDKLLKQNAALKQEVETLKLVIEKLEEQIREFTKVHEYFESKMGPGVEGQPDNVIKQENDRLIFELESRKREYSAKIAELKGTISFYSTSFPSIVSNYTKKESDECKEEVERIRAEMAARKSEYDEKEEKFNCLVQNLVHRQSEDVKHLEDKLLQMTVKVKQYEVQTAELEKKHTTELEALKQGFIDLLTKVEVSHREAIGEMEVKCATEILKIHSMKKEEFSRIENKIKEDALKIYVQDIEKLSANYKRQFEETAKTVADLEYKLDDKIKHIETLKILHGKLQTDYEVQAKQIAEFDEVKMGLNNLKLTYEEAMKDSTQQINAFKKTEEKLNLEIEKLQTKYEKCRSIAFNLKRQLERKADQLKTQKKQYVESLNNVQVQLDEALAVDPEDPYCGKVSSTTNDGKE